jgi:hypothetical protein
MFIRITLLGLTIHFGIVCTSIVILTIVVLAAIVVAVLLLLSLRLLRLLCLSTSVIKHGSVGSVAMSHLVHVVCRILRILLIVSIGIAIARITMALTLHMARVLLSRVAGHTRRRSVLTTSLRVLCHTLLRA